MTCRPGSLCEASRDRCHECLNAGPEAIVADEIRDLLVSSEPGRVAVELTEQVKVDDHSGLLQRLRQLHLVGVRLAIDDTGAGFASLACNLKLGPDIIKLDREITSGIDRDPVRSALATALVSFASRLGAEIIAEGIETAAELEVLRELGIGYGQGYFLCRPTSVESIPNCLSDKVLLARSSRAS
ncbi:MAG: EAL domain-containing protein [Acidimicrobiales bacterium]